MLLYTNRNAITIPVASEMPPHIPFASVYSGWLSKLMLARRFRIHWNPMFHHKSIWGDRNIMIKMDKNQELMQPPLGTVMRGRPVAIV
jgi:hypothetical protein